MVYHHETFPSRGFDIEQIHGVLMEELDEGRFRDSWLWLVSRHPALRRFIEWSAGADPVQVESEAALDFRWVERPATFDLGSLLETDRREGFDLGQAPLSRVQVFRLGPKHFEFLWSFHHILFDGRSFPLLLTELFDHYDGKPVPPPDGADPFVAHLDLLSSRSWGQDRAHWKTVLSGFDRPTPLPLAATNPEVENASRPDLTPLQLESRLDLETTEALVEAARSLGLGLNTMVQAAWGIALSRFTGSDDVVFGATRACRHSGVEGARDAVGVFINTLPVRVRPKRKTVKELLTEVRTQDLAAREHELCPLTEVQAAASLPAGQPLFETNIVFDNYGLDQRLKHNGGPWETRSFELHESAPFALTLYGNQLPELVVRIATPPERFEQAEVEWLLQSVCALLRSFAQPGALGSTVDGLSMLEPQGRRTVLEQWNSTDRGVVGETVPDLFEQQVSEAPDRIALVAPDRTLTYRELDERASALAGSLLGAGISGNAIVGLCAERSSELVIGALAILKAGAAYLPLDPGYPQDRLSYMVEDSGTRLVLGDHHAASLAARTGTPHLPIAQAEGSGAGAVSARKSEQPSRGDLAYVIYTSGSTGRPKGVMVEHRNVVNFFAAMDEQVPDCPERTWLAVTSLSFDISVLEIFWTLCRGTRVVLGSELGQFSHHPAGPSFSLLYFAAGEGSAENPYRLLLEGAQWADREGFEAVWIPERHFHEFGGLYPNPSVAGAAVAATTRNIGIRAGSVVSPLHHPARIAEEWSVVDNLSGGRVGLSFASGWHPNDFVLKPENYEDRRALVGHDINVVRALWRGEEKTFKGPGQDVSVRTLPRPVQSELPVWLTSAGNPDTYREAGELGVNILTHLLGQSLEEVATNLRIYREARAAAGHVGPGQATLMLHTFIGHSDDEVKSVVREPMKNYLRSSLGLIRGFASQWSAYKRGSTTEISLDDLDASEMDALLDFSFERYYETSALFGTVDRASALVADAHEHGIDEIACLIDFGVDTQTVLDHLPLLGQLKDATTSAAQPLPLSSLIEEQQVTHLQCTPSLARILLEDDSTRTALSRLSAVLIGGEALPPHLAAELLEAGPRLFNMYGPTETTIWSTVHELQAEDAARPTVPIGRPVANTKVYVLDEGLRPVPPGVVGELYIAGHGVVRGYWQRPELTCERFVVSDHIRGDQPAAPRLYRTGDLAHWSHDGLLHYDGRADFQVKLRGHRIELGEIEAVLAQQTGVRDTVVVVREDRPDDQQLVAYFTADDSEAATQEVLRASLRKVLPEFMVPTTVVRIDALPLTPNGKVDRKALPRPDQPAPNPARATEAPAAADVAPPSSSANVTEEKPSTAGDAATRALIARIWATVLGRSEVGLNDNFFDLGGHSLLAVRAHRELKAAVCQDLQITDLFRFPTVQSLAAHVAGAGGMQLPTPRAGASHADSGDESAPETASQRRARLRRRRRRGNSS